MFIAYICHHHPGGRRNLFSAGADFVRYEPGHC